MGIDDELRKQGYEFDEDCTGSKPGAEIWINKEIGIGLRLEWFRLQ